VAKFVLTDHSICNLAGHHYEYAIHVLRAAERAGFEPVLVTNRKFKETGGVPCPVVPLYQFGFWPEPGAMGLLARCLLAWRHVKQAWFGFRCRLRFSTFGLAWLGRTRWKLHVKRRPAAAGEVPGYLTALALVVLFKFLRTLCLVLLLPFWLVAFAFSCGMAVARFAARFVAAHMPPGRQRQYLGLLIQDARTYLEFAGILWRFAKPTRSSIGRLLKLMQESRQARAFERDTRALFRRLSLADGDVLFYPTISARDTYGLAKSMPTASAAGLPSVHLLFRRNIYTGRRQGYHAQRESVAEMRRILAATTRLPASAKFSFYTDTDELSHQHNTLGGFPFHTVPIPHTYAALDRPASTGPIRITYLGDARREKGFHLLPQLVATLAGAGVQPDLVRYIVQCNYNVPGGEPAAAIARGELEMWPADLVELYKEPLTSEEYKGLLLSAGINLLLYDPENYYARSSGILVESLAAGIPVIAPANTWLSRQFLAPFNRHLEGLAQSQTILASFTRDAVAWQRRYSSGDITGTHDWCWLRIPAGTTHLLLRGEFGSLSTETGLCIGRADSPSALLSNAKSIVLEADNRRCCAWLVRVGEARPVRISVPCVEGEGGFPFRSFRCDCLYIPEERSTPTGAVGQIYQCEDDIPRLVCEMIDHYSHYRRTAFEYAAEIRGYHNPDRLVAALLQTAGIEPKKLAASAVV
jgi:hypothetical protein